MVVGGAACVVVGVHGCRGACVVAGGCAWLWGVYCCRGACVVVGGVHGCGGGMHGCGRGGGMHGCRGLHGCGIRRDTVNERAVRILLECILVSVVASLPS